jgi:hypothetical protein
VRLPFVEGHSELSHDDAAERRQRLLSLAFRQPTPQLIETYGPAANSARGGTMTAISPGMGRLLGPILGKPESIPTAATGRQARLSRYLPIPVKSKKWG